MLLLAALPWIVGVGARPSAAASGDVLFEESFEGDLSRWEESDDDAIAIVDSSDARHWGVLRLRPEHSTLYASGGLFAAVGSLP